MKVEVVVKDVRLQDKIDYATEHAAGIDLRACSVKIMGVHMALTEDATFTLHPGEQVEVGSGIHVHIGSCAGEVEDKLGSSMVLAGMLLPRSGMGTKHRLRLSNTVGLIDADYQGEIMMVYENGSHKAFEIKPLERLAQLVIVPVVRVGFAFVPSFSADTVRGSGGFGSTGTK